MQNRVADAGMARLFFRMSSCAIHGSCGNTARRTSVVSYSSLLREYKNIGGQQWTRAAGASCGAEERRKAMEDNSPGDSNFDMREIYLDI
jgi:hypothetical protein